MMMRRAVDEQGAQCRVQARPGGAGEARVAVRDEHVRQPHVRLMHPPRRVGTGRGYSRPAGGRCSASTR